MFKQFDLIDETKDLVDTVSGIDTFAEKVKQKPARKKKKIKKLKIMTEEWWPELEEMLYADIPSPEIVDYLLKKEPYCNWKKSSITPLVFKLKKHLAPRHRIRREKEYVQIHMEQLGGEHIEPEIALQTLGYLAMDRVLLEYDNEKSGHKTCQLNNSNIKMVKEIFESIAKIQIDRKKANIPLINVSNTQNNMFNNVERVKEQFIQRYGERVANVMIEPESRKKVLDTLELVRNIGTGPISERLKGMKGVFNEPEENQTNVSGE